MGSRLGQTIGSYHIVRELGSGGMGTVYEVMHQQLGRRAAIKILRPEASRRGDLVERLFNEARAVNLVGHPGLVDIFELGRLPDGSAYILMEYLRGETLAARMQRQSIEVGQCVRLGRQAAAALAAAHGCGIVHRDIKPENLMIVPDPEVLGGERVKILDFGIAKYADRAGSLHLRQGATANGMVLGTPVYMAPEQCRGGAVDGRADVYALGVVLYEMLCGRPPFVASSSGMVMVLHLTQQPPDLRGMISGLSPVLYALVEAMLAKDPDRRPSMRTVCEVLERLEAQPQALTRPQPSAPAPSQDTLRPVSRTMLPPRQWPRRSRIAAAMLGVGIGVLMLLGLLERHRGGAIHAVPIRAVPESTSPPPGRLLPPPHLWVPEQVPAVEPPPAGWAAVEPIRMRLRRARSAP
ncbi:MAG: serine/threonine-protein kinase [Myxococcales bacterium]|nr:serine/threonine protein kinase [Myxococcota bacterium]MDW8282272.1 serine/threonine-protein kinase [Myxococcales bacterium]